MTFQKSKSPNEIAEDILEMNRKNPTMDSSRLLSLISQAIKAERESNRLVLPERKVMNFEWCHEHENSSTFGFNRCLDEVIKLNAEKVGPEEGKC